MSKPPIGIISEEYLHTTSDGPTQWAPENRCNFVQLKKNKIKMVLDYLGGW